MQVVDEHHQRGAARGELGEDEVQAVPDALRVEGAGALLGLLEAHGRSDDLLPGAHHLAELAGLEAAQHRLEQLAQHVVRLVELALAAAGEQHGGVGAELGDPADLVQQTGLADAGPAGEGEEFADLGAAGREVAAEFVHRRLGGAEFGVTVTQPDPAGGAFRLPRAGRRLRPEFAVPLGHRRASASPFPARGAESSAAGGAVERIHAGGGRDRGFGELAEGNCPISLTSDHCIGYSTARRPS